MLRHQNKKQVFAFNIYKNHVRKLSENEIFNKKSDIGKISVSNDSLEESEPSVSDQMTSNRLKARVKFDLNLHVETKFNNDIGNQTVQTNFRSNDNYTPLLNPNQSKPQEPITTKNQHRTSQVWTGIRSKESENVLLPSDPVSSIKFQSIHLQSSPSNIQSQK